MPDLSLAHEQIKRRLLRRIGSEWRAGAQLPPVMDLARQMRSGQRNTQRALAELAAEGVIVSRRGKGTFVAEGVEHALRQRKADGLLAGHHVGLVAGDYFAAPFYEVMIETLRESLIACGASATHLPVNWGSKEGRADPRVAACTALVLINPASTKPVQLVADVPTVILSTSGELTVRGAGGYDVVGVDDRHGGFLAGDALKRAGCTTPCFIGVVDGRDPTQYTDISIARYRGFRTGVRVDPLNEHLFRTTSFSIAAGARCARRFLELKQRPDGVFAVSDELAMGFAMGTIAAGVEPGRDYKLVGFDGNHADRPVADCPPITSALPPSADMARRAADLLAQRIIQPDRPAGRALFSCTLFEGGTA